MKLGKETISVDEMVGLAQAGALMSHRAFIDAEEPFEWRRVYLYYGPPGYRGERHGPLIFEFDAIKMSYIEPEDSEYLLRIVWPDVDPEVSPDDGGFDMSRRGYG